MKRLIPLCLSILIFSQVSAFASEKKLYSCEDIYALQLANKLEDRGNYNKIWNTNLGYTSLNQGITIVGFVGSLATGSLPIILAASLPAGVISLIKNVPTKEERIKILQEETSGRFKRFVKRMQRIDKSITAEEVAKQIQDGFDSGLYCENLPDVLSPKDIRKQVKGFLKLKYGKED